MDTLGLVKLNFGILNRNKKAIADITDAQELFKLAKYLSSQQQDETHKKQIQSHLDKATLAQEEAEDWD